MPAEGWPGRLATLSWNVLRRLLLFIRGLSELSGSLSDTMFPSQPLISAAIVKVLPGKLG